MPSLTDAQVPAEPDRLAAVRGIDTGKYFRVDIAAGPRVEGNLAVNGDTSIAVFRDEVPVIEIPIPDIDRLWVRGRATWTGALTDGLAFGPSRDEPFGESPEADPSGTEAI